MIEKKQEERKKTVSNAACKVLRTKVKSVRMKEKLQKRDKRIGIEDEKHSACM